MIKHLTPKSEKELAQVKLNECKEIEKFAIKKLKNFKKLPSEISMLVRSDFYFQIELDNTKKWRLFYPLQNAKSYYKLSLTKSKSGKWKVISISHNDESTKPI